MKQRNIPSIHLKNRAPLWVPPVSVISYNTWVPPALFQAFSGLGAPATSYQCKCGKPNVILQMSLLSTVLLGDSTAVKSSRVLVDQVMGSTKVLSLTRLRTLTPSKQWDHCLLQPIVQVSCSHICLPISILKRCMYRKKHEIRRCMWALFTNS